MAQLPGTPTDVRRLVPAVDEAYALIRDTVLEDGPADRSLKELCYRYLASDPAVMDFGRYEGRERAALDWADAIAYDSDRADDALWSRLHALFTEPELVDLGCAIGFELGQQHWRRTIGLPHREERAAG